MGIFINALMAVMMAATLQATATPVAENAAEAAPQQSTVEKIVANLPRLSGFLHTGWSYTSNDLNSTSSFQAKRLRLALDGNIGSKIAYHVQIEAFNSVDGATNGNGQYNLDVMEAHATWKPHDAFQVQVGQFFTPLGMETYDISPASLETPNYSDIVYRIACRNPYEYNFCSNGVDLGIMLMGDLIDSGKGFKYLHYDIALSNGSLAMKDDSNKSKDIYLRATIQPTNHLTIKGTYNWGEYTSRNLAGGIPVTAPTGENKYNPMSRCVVGASYDNPNGLDLRAEYGFMKSKVDGTQVVDEAGAYILAGYRFGKFLPSARWEIYQDKVNDTASCNYNRMVLGCVFRPFDHVRLQAAYSLTFYRDHAATALGYDRNHHLQLMAIVHF